MTHFEQHNNNFICFQTFYIGVNVHSTCKYYYQISVKENIKNNFLSYFWTNFNHHKAVFTCVRTRHPHTSSAHVIRTRHPHTSSARGVHMCSRPLSVKYVEYRILFFLSVVLYHCFYGKLLKCLKCGCYMYVCKSCLSLW